LLVKFDKDIKIMGKEFFVFVVILVLFAGSVTANDISHRCESKWESNQQMIDFCIKTQSDAKKMISAHTGSIRTRC